MDECMDGCMDGCKAMDGCTIVIHRIVHMYMYMLLCTHVGLHVDRLSYH